MPIATDSSMPFVPNLAQQSPKTPRCSKRSRHSRKRSLVPPDVPARQSSLPLVPSLSPALSPHIGLSPLRRLWSRPTFIKTFHRRLRALQPRHSGVAATLHLVALHPCIQSRFPTYSRAHRSNLPYRRTSTRLSMQIAATTTSVSRLSVVRASLHRSTRSRTRIRSQ